MATKTERGRADQAGAEPPEPGGPAPAWSRFGDTLTGVVVKLVFLAAINGAAVFMVLEMIRLDAPWWAIGFTIAATVAIDWIYLGKYKLPLKYLVPGVVFLVIFQVFPFIYTFYIAFTNYGLGNVLTQDQAIEQIEAQSVVSVEDAPRFAAVPLADNGDVGLLLTGPDDQQHVGTEEGLTPVEQLDPETDADGDVVAVGGFERQSLGQMQDRLEQYEELLVPTPEGDVQLISLTQAAVREQLRTYDPEREVLVDEVTGTEYVTSEEGYFVDAEGNRISPGWRVVTGWDNFTRAVTSPAVRGPFLRVLGWTYVFAFFSTMLTFVLGLVLAMSLNDERIRGRKFFRLAMIIPYALPTFLTALIWRGMMNRSFGVLNDVVGYPVPWLTDPTVAKVSVLLVNLWFGFPYMFLIVSAALQSIPDDVYEAAKVDGASGGHRFRFITLPLLLVSTAPVLIATFAFNFNNFNVIYLLTGGNPARPDTDTPVGFTDILISYTYRLAFEAGGGQDYAFGAAIAVFTFLMVAVISVVLFKFTKPFEEVH